MKKVKLEEVVTLKKGKKATILDEQTILSQRYIQIDDLRNDNNLKFTESLNMTEALLDDVLIAWDGANAGTIGYGLSGAVGSTIMVLKKNEQYKDEIISEYLGVFLESKSQYLRYHSTGATIPHLNKNILLDLKLELLRIEEQENIICILNIIKKLITKRKCQLKELNSLVKSRFNEMFGDPVFNEMRWRRCKLKDISVEKLAYGSGASAIDFSGLRYIRITDIDECGNLKIDKKSPSHYDEKYLLNTGDILFARSGATVGKTFLYSKEKYGPAQYAGYLIRLIPNLSLVNPVFVYHFTNTKFYNDFIAKVQNAVAQPNINAKQYGELDFILPPLSLQNEFADFVAQVDKSQLAIQKSLEELETLKKSLMQEYFG
ncbi:type I restriction-modification system S subunit [Streptococcus mitis]|uniref:Type I restriction-modification system S subunit n=1 Tax=Streptococcus mitis TaxID=28037 RepID=A0A0F2DCJ4_STRMT|nr:restriction endonuclease subunit S [Streptococcus mitis]KJQ68613.1 type I restriction-modification system S subunit [Streptococcus mitis]